MATRENALLDKTTRPLRSLDIVVPVFNEEAVVPLLLARLSDVFSVERLGPSGLGPVRVVFVDDGSRDHTAQLLAEAISGGFPGLLLRLSRNFGHQASLSAGLDRVDADLVAVLDADLQDPPELIPEMAAKLGSGSDIAYGIRRDRKDSLPKRVGVWAFYRIAAWLADIELPLDTGDFCVMTRRVVEALRTLPESLRFHRVLRAWVGFKQVAVPYARPERAAGVTKYSWKRLYRLATDGIAAASVRPLRLAQVLATLCFAGLVAASVGVVVYHERLSQIRPVTLLLALLLVTMMSTGSLMFCIYILGAYIGRTYLEVKARPAYVIMETVPPTSPFGTNRR